MYNLHRAICSSAKALLNLLFCLFLNSLYRCYVRLGGIDITKNNKSGDKERQSPCEEEFSIE